MKIAVFGDRHISKQHPAYREALAMWDWAITDAIQQQVSLFLCLGDVCEVGVQPDEIYEIGVRYDRMLDHAPVVEVDGNHGARLGLRWAKLIGRGVEVIDATIHPYIGLSGVTILGAPYCRRGHAPYEAIPTDIPLADYYGQAAQLLGARINEERERSGRDLLIVAGHWTPAGFKVGPSDLEQTGSKEMVVPLDVLARADQVYVGHIHQAQEIGLVHGVGAMFRTTFAEVGQEKSYTLVEITGHSISNRRVPLPCRPMREVRVSGAKAAETVASIVAAGANQDVKVIVEASAGDPAIYSEILAPLDALSGRAPWQVQREQVIKARAPELELAQNLVEEFDIYLRSTQPTLPDDVRSAVLHKVELLHDGMSA